METKFRRYLHMHANIAIYKYTYLQTIFPKWNLFLIPIQGRDRWLLHGIIIPIVLEGVSQLPVSDNDSDDESKSDIESDTKSKKPLDPIIGRPSNLYNLSFLTPTTTAMS
jgi:hypothetical protein